MTSWCASWRHNVLFNVITYFTTSWRILHNFRHYDVLFDTMTYLFWRHDILFDIPHLWHYDILCYVMTYYDVLFEIITYLTLFLTLWRTVWYHYILSIPYDIIIHIWLCTFWHYDVLCYVQFLLDDTFWRHDVFCYVLYILFDVMTYFLTFHTFDIMTCFFMLWRTMT